MTEASMLMIIILREERYKYGILYLFYKFDIEEAANIIFIWSLLYLMMLSKILQLAKC